VSALKDTISAVFSFPAERDWLGVRDAAVSSALFDFVVNAGSAASAAASPTTTTAAANTMVGNSSGLLGYSISSMKKAYGIPTDLAATNAATTAMVWGPGTFGYSKMRLELLKATQCPGLNTKKVLFDTANHGQSGGDNYGEGNLDTQMVSTFGMNATIVVSNTNTSSSTEEGKGFGEAMLLFLTELSSRAKLPQILSLSLGSLSAYSCDL
jgi:hypothetical protein